LADLQGVDWFSARALDDEALPEDLGCEVPPAIPLLAVVNRARLAMRPGISAGQASIEEGDRFATRMLEASRGDTAAERGLER